MVNNPFDGTQACSKADPEIFFPEDYLDQKAMEEPRRVCASCNIKAECLEYAVSDPSLQGIWAGTTPRQRIKLRSRRRAVTWQKVSVS